MSKKRIKVGITMNIPDKEEKYIRKCFKVNYCEHKEHSPECEKCIWYRKK